MVMLAVWRRMMVLRGVLHHLDGKSENATRLSLSLSLSLLPRRRGIAHEQRRQWSAKGERGRSRSTPSRARDNGAIDGRVRWDVRMFGVRWRTMRESSTCRGSRAVRGAEINDGE